MVDFASRILKSGVDKPASPGKELIDTLDTKPPADQQTAVGVVSGGKGASFGERVLQRSKLAESGIHTASPQDADASSRNDTLSNQLAEKGLPTKLGEPGSLDYLTRADLGLSDTFDEKREKFLTKYPDGDFIEVNEPGAEYGSDSTGRGGKTVLFRRAPTEDFAELDARMLDKFELIGDLADISGDVPAMVAQAVITNGGSIAAQVLQVASGQIAGDAAKEVLESLRGYQQETFGEQVKRIGGRAVVAAGGALATTTVTGPLNAVRGSGSIKLLPGAKEAQRAATELNIPNFLPNQIAASPIVRRLGSQSNATVSTIGEYLRQQQASAVAAFSRMRDTDALRVAAMSDVEKLHDDAMKQIINAVTLNKKSLTEGGDAIQRGIVEYEDLSGTIVNRMYEDARAIDTPKFDISSLVAVAKNVEAGVLAKGTGGKDVPTGLFDAAGNAITKKEDELIQLRPLQKTIREVVEKIKSIDPSLPQTTLPDGTAVTATDQLLALRSNLWELKQISPIGTASPEERLAAAQAEKLYQAINHTLRNPKNADPSFVNVWRAAQGEAAKRFDTLEKIIIVKATQTETPAQLASRLAQPLQVDNLKILKDTIPADKFRLFQDSVKTHFTNPQNINTLSRRLDKFDQETMDLLLTKTDQADLRDLGNSVDNLNKAGIKKVVEDQASVQSAITQMTVRNDTAGLDAFIRNVENLPPRDPSRRMVRGAIIQDVYDKVVKNTARGIQIDGPGLVKEVTRLKESGLLHRVLSSEDRRILANFDKLGLFLNVAEDSGTSLQAASVAANIRAGNVEGFRTLIETMSTGRFFTSQLGQRILLGSGKDRLKFSKTRVVGAIIANEAANITGETEE